MNKFRLFLTTTSALIIIGGILAFKAKKYGVSYCIGTRYVEGNTVGFCPDVISATTDNAITFYYAKVKLGSCSGEICPSLALTAESPQ